MEYCYAECHSFNYCIVLRVIMFSIIVLSVAILGVVMLTVYAGRRYAKCHHAECHSAILPAALNIWGHNHNISFFHNLQMGPVSRSVT